jgi:HEAT repeat protein
MRKSERTLAERTARRREAALAGHRGDRDAALEFVSDVDAEVRATALRAVARCGRVPAPLLVEAALDDTPLVRRAAAELIGREGSDPALDEPLLRLLADDDVAVVEMAAWAAGERERPTTPIVDRLCVLATDHDDALVREAAVAALGALGDRRGLDAILRATTDKATVRRRAVLALAPFDGPDVDAALDRALTDRDWQVRQAAEDLTD